MPSRPNDDCLHLALNAEDNTQLNALSNSLGIPRLQLVRMILRQYLASNPPVAPKIAPIKEQANAQIL